MTATGPDRPVIEVGFGILVYPPQGDAEPWRATFTENGPRCPACRQLCYLCVDLGPRDCCLRHPRSLSSCVTAGERAGNHTCTRLPRQDSNLEPAG